MKENSTLKEVANNYLTHTKSSKGITLIALVITIIILLILAGISIATLTNTGLFEKAKEAEQKSKNAQELGNITLADYENKIDSAVNVSRDTVTISKEEYDNLKKSTETVVYNNLDEIIELNENVNSLEGQVQKQGKIANVNLTISFKKQISTSTWVTVGTLKNSSFNPDIEQWGYLAQAANDGNFVITTDGIIKIRAQTSSTGYIGNITYFLK